MSIIWWEKTVEYYFIKSYVDLSMFIAPLDGTYEKAGDTIFGTVTGWVLIEFKRNLASIKAEVQKYTSYELAKENLKSKDNHHLIIYGEEVNNELSLKCQRYFSEQPIPIEATFNVGIPLNPFMEYLQKLIRYKNESGGGAGSFGYVAGVDTSGSIVKCLKLNEFLEGIKMEKEQRQQLEVAPRSKSKDQSKGMSL